MNFLDLLLGGWQRILLYGAVAAAVCAGLIGYGYHKGVQRLWEYQAAQARETVRIVTKQGKVTEKVVTKYVKVAGETQVVTNTIEKEVVRYAEKNPGACLDDDWRRLHDAAASNTLPKPAAPADGAVRAPGADPGR